MKIDFKNWFTEVSHEDLAKIGSEVNASLAQNRRGDTAGLMFDNIFGNKLRVVIPIEDRQERLVRNTLSSLGYEVNYRTGMATSTVQTERGPKERSERIGAVLNKLSRKDPRLGEFLHWWEKNKLALGRPKQGGVSIIISRSPIDILRMSDHSEWSSCHSPGNSFYKCAIQEAKTGGAIAYVVRNSDLAKIPNLQAKDIFSDRERHVIGIEPLERVRLRRFGDNDIDLLIPDTRTYGIQHVDFVETVRDWAKSVQKDLVDFDNPPNYRDFNLYGGSYQDTPAWALWNKFFGTNVTGDKSSIDQDEEAYKNGDEDADAIYNQAMQQLNERNFKHYYVSIMDDANTLHYEAYLTFTFPVKAFIQVPTYRDSNKILNQIRDTFVWPGRMENLNIDVSDKIVQFHCSFGDIECDGSVDQFEHFLDDVQRADDKYDEAVSEVWEDLIRRNWLHQWRETLSNIQFQHFTFNWGKHETEFISEPMLIGDLEGVPHDRINIFRMYNGTFLINFRETFSKSPFANGAVFPSFIEISQLKIYIERAFSQREDDTPINFPIPVYLKIDIEIENPSKIQKLLSGLQYIDRHWDFFHKKATNYFQYIKQIVIASTENNIADPGQAWKRKLPRIMGQKKKQLDLPFSNESFIAQKNLPDFW